MKQEYKWTIIRDADGFYVLKGYVKIEDKWSLDGIPLIWSYIEAPLEHIRKQENAQS